MEFDAKTISQAIGGLALGGGALLCVLAYVLDFFRGHGADEADERNPAQRSAALSNEIVVPGDLLGFEADLADSFARNCHRQISPPFSFLRIPGSVNPTDGSINWIA